MAIGAMLGSAVIGGGMGLAATSKASKAARAAAAQATAESGRQFDEAMKEMREAAEYLESLGVPPVEAQRIALESANLGPSALEDVETDPRLKQAQMDALARIQEMGGAGLTAEERAQQDMITRSAGAEAQARDKSILQNMAERGIGGSGAELMARLQGSQSAADRAAVQQGQLSGQAQNRALQALSQAGQLGGQIRGQEYGEQSNLASARDRIAQFNEANRVQAANQAEMYNKGLIQQQYENELAKRQGVAAAKTGTAQMGVDRAGQIQLAGTAAAQGELQTGAAKAGLWGGLGQAGIKAAGSYTPSGSTGGRTTASQSTTSGTTRAGGNYMTPNYEDGGMTYKYAGGGMPVPEEYDETPDLVTGEVIPGDDFEGDRVDAKINSGEMVLNIEQQQRLMELLKGLRDLKGLGDEDIIEPTSEAAEVEIEPAFAHGGMVPSEYKTPTEAKPRGIHASLKHEKAQQEKQASEEKARKARIKAYETLINGGR